MTATKKITVYTLCWEGDDINERFGCRVYTNRRERDSELATVLQEHAEYMGVSIENKQGFEYDNETLYELLQGEGMEASFDWSETVLEVPA